MRQNNKLTLLLSLPSIDGSIALAALGGMFTMQNAFANAVVFLAGPASIVAAALFGGSIRERMFAALVSGVIATIIVVFSAGLGPRLLQVMNVGVLKVIGGLAVLVIGLLIMGVKLPERLPVIIMITGIVVSFILR